ncbi:MAG: hypothetical protein M3446_11815 [Actinomycetota bacterium]|nr:hypothetical protein [Actinomycetota bacterium]
MSRSYEDPLGDHWPAADSVSASTPATSARALADILREAGVSSTGAGGRRRRRADDDSPSDEDARADLSAAANGVTRGGETAFDRSASEATDTFGIVDRGGRVGADDRAAAAEQVTHDTQTDFGSLSSYLLSSTHTAPTRAVPESAAPTRAGPESAAPSRAGPESAATPETGRRRDPPPRTDTGPVPTHGWASRASGQQAGSGASASTDATAADGLTTPAKSAEIPSATATGAAGNGGPHAPAHANRSPSPLAPAPADDPSEDDSAVAVHSGAISWAILVVELLAALGLGVAAWYAFSALWELLPYAAALAGPLVVTGLVAVAGALRARTGRNPLGLPTLCILVFAGTVLVVLPAATLIVP